VQRRDFLGLAVLSATRMQAQDRSTPQAFYDKVLRNPNLHKNGHGEDFCWNAAYELPARTDADGA
jgi:hypothetical protein